MRIVLVILLLGFIGWQVIINVPQPSQAMAALEASNELENSGVSHPITAVLLNFRATDTLLEVVVLLIAFIAFSGFSKVSRHQNYFRPGSMPLFLAKTLAPFFLVGSVYLWLIGAYDSGGAFQAGALLAAFFLLSSLARVSILAHFNKSFLVGSFGILIFLLFGFASLPFGGFFAYRGNLASFVITALEGFLTLSIAFILAGFFWVNEPTRKRG